MRNKEGVAAGKRISRLAQAAAALLMCLILSVTGLATSAAGSEMPDLDRKGSLSITFTCDGQPISNGNKVGIFKVADAVFDDSHGYKFVWNGEFAAVGAMPKNLDAVNGELAEKLVSIAKDKRVPLYRNSQELDENGDVKFNDLEVGLYLVVHTKKVEITLSDKSKVTYTINPFLVSVPQKEGEALTYDVATNPKVSPEKSTTPPPKKPTPPPKRVPQTGQLWWPVFVLGIAGMIFITAGFVRKSKNSGTGLIK